MDDLRAVAELARLDAPPDRARRFTLMTAPASDPTAQSDCDCACPTTPLPPSPARSLRHSDQIRLHPDVTFVPLNIEHEEQSGVESGGTGATAPPLYPHPTPDQADANAQFLLFIPSALSGIVVNGALRDSLLGLRAPRPAAEVLADIPSDLLERLYELGVLIDERPAVPPPASETLVAWLHVTNACNLRCSYCYLHKTDEPMDSATGRAALDAIARSAEAHGYRAIKLKFAGGEASLNFALVWELHDYAQQIAAARGLALDAVVLSNGVGLARRSLLELRRRGIRLMISLDGFAADHDAQRVFANGRGSFQAVARTIERARELGLLPDISVTVSGRTAGGLAALIEWLVERDLPFSLNFYRESDCSAGFQDLLLDERRIVAGMLAAFRAIERRVPARSLLGGLIDRANLAAPHSKPCGVGESYMVIDQRGGVAKCQMEIERPVTTVHADDPLGVIRADTIGVRNLAVQQREGCRDCSWRLWCAGGCPIATFRATGRYDVRSPNCGIYRALYPEAVRLEGLRILKHGAREHYGAISSRS